MNNNNNNNNNNNDNNNNNNNNNNMSTVKKFSIKKYDKKYTKNYFYQNIFLDKKKIFFQIPLSLEAI